MSVSKYSTQYAEEEEFTFLNLKRQIEQNDMFSFELMEKQLFQTLDKVDGGNLLKIIWIDFFRKCSSDSSLFVFAELLKTFQSLSKSTLNELSKELHNVVKYNIPYKKNKEDTAIIYYIPNMNIFHPINIDISFKILTEYLVKNKQETELNKIHRPSVYYKLIDELNNQCTSIYKSLQSYKVAFDTYISKTNPMFDTYFNPKLSFDEMTTFLVKHSDKDLYSSVYNRYIESEIFKLIQRNYDKNLIPFQEDELISKYQHRNNIIFNAEQINAITSTISEPITIIQGSAGTGKSTLISAITDILLARKEKIIFLTISTKARDIINDKLKQYYQTITFDEMATLPRAYTISKFLCRQKFDKTKYDNIIVDEASMIGNSQLNNFLSSFTKRLILMGDGKQVLPVKQNGTPFISLQNCECMEAFINICELKIIKRQASDNPIIDLVNNLLNKKPITLPEYNNEKYGVFYKTIDSSNYEQKYSKFYINFYKDEQFNKSICCIKPAYYAKISQRIHEDLFEHEIPIATQNSQKMFNTIFIDDFMMRTKTETFDVKDPENHTKKITIEVPNGSYCKVVKVDDYGCIIVEYTNIKCNGELFRERVMKRKIFFDFQLAYCQSTHKFQGSEYDNVFFNLNNNPYITKDEGKNILYTSITRAKKLLVICGTKSDNFLINKVILNEFCNPDQDIMNGTKSNFISNDIHKIMNSLEDIIPKYNGQYDAPDMESYYNSNGTENVFENEKVIENDRMKVIENEIVKPNTNYQCECGSNIKNDKFCIEKHNKTKKHLKYLST